MYNGLLRRMTSSILADPYANAFTQNLYDPTPNIGDKTSTCTIEHTKENAMVPGLWERKFELDSPLSLLKLSASYHDATKDLSPFDGSWRSAVTTIVRVVRDMQLSSEEDAAQVCGPSYNFERCTSCNPTDSLVHGTGEPAARTGMARSAFRPSDDACALPFLVPANAMAVVELRRTAWLLEAIAANETTNTTGSTGTGTRGSISAGAAEARRMAADAFDLANELDAGIQKSGLMVHPHTEDGPVYAYEVDGFGNAKFMDDANVPSLLSLPFLGYLPRDDPVYQRTRSLLLSGSSNPFFFRGTAGEGIGSPHTGPGAIWPMAVIVQALTSDDDVEIFACLQTLKAAAAKTGMMHESFHRDDAGQFTRPWFAWANSWFGELVLRISEERPHLLRGGGAVGNVRAPAVGAS